MSQHILVVCLSTPHVFTSVSVNPLFLSSYHPSTDVLAFSFHTLHTGVLYITTMSSYTRQLLAFADVLQRLHNQTSTPADYTATLTTLSTITRNLLTHPLPPRYTTLNLALPALQQKLARYPAAVEWLRLVGFERDVVDAVEAEEAGRLVVRGEVDRKVVDVAVQVIEGGLEEAKRDEEKAAVKQSADAGADVEMRSTQEDEDRKLSERLQREENNRNKRPSKAADASPADDSEHGERESDADLRVKLQADYNISDVKRALSALKQQIQSTLSTSSSSSLPSSPPSDSDNYATSDAYLASLTLLHKITTNLRTGDDKYRTLKLSNPTLATKLAAYPAALDYLRFLGFEEKEERTMRVERVDGVRVDRAAVILQRVIEAETPTEEEKEHRALGAVDRELRVMEYEPAMLNERLAAREEEAPEAPDMKLLLSVAAEDRRRNEMLARTDAFVTRHKQAELKQRYKRHYSRTLLRVVCQPDNTIVTAYFRPLEKIATLFALLTPMLQPEKASTFVLRLPPQQKLTVSKDGVKTMQSLGLVPAATLYIGSENDTSGATPTRWLRDDIWQQRTHMIAVPVPVAENAAEIAEKKREDRLGTVGGGGGSEAAGRGGGGGGGVERKSDADEMDDEALERELKRMKAEKAKKKSAAADAAARRVAR